MTDLLPEDRALLDLARDGHGPSRADRARVRTALIVQLGVGTGLATAASTSTAAAGTAGLAVTSAAVGVAVKVLAVVVVVGAIGGGGALAVRAAKGPSTTTTTSGARLAAPMPTAVARPSDPVAETLAPLELIATPSPALAAVAIPPAARVVPVLAPPRPRSDDAQGSSVRSTSDPVVAPVERESSSEAAPAPSPLSPTTLENETRLVRAGIAALHAGDPAGALAFFDEHARSYPNGALAEERAAERVTALCDLARDDEARRAAAAFVREHPHSPLAARVSAGCAGARP